MTTGSVETNSRKVLNAGLWYTLSSFLTKGIVFITTPIFTRILTGEEFGEYCNFVAWSGIITIIASMEMHATVNRARYDFDNIDGYLSSVAISGTITTCVLWTVVQLFSSFFCQYLSMDIRWINLLFLTTLVSPALSLFQAKNRIKYQYKTFVFLSFGSVFLSTIVSLLLVLLMSNKLIARIYGQYGTIFIIDICVYFYIIFKGHQFKWSECKYALLICIPTIPHLLSMYILNQSDRIMIKQFCGATETAYYSLAYSCAMIPMMLAQATNIAWSPWSSEMIFGGNFEKIKRFSYYYICFFYSILVSIFFLGPEIIYILGGEEYASSVDVMLPIVMGAAFQFLYSLYVGLEQFAKRTVGMALASVTVAIINVALNWIMIPKFGYTAAAYTSLISYAFLLTIHYFLATKTEYIAAYDTKFIFISVLFLLLLMFAFMWLYTISSLIRYVLALVFILSLVYNIYKKKSILISVIHK